MNDRESGESLEDWVGRLPPVFASHSSISRDVSRAQARGLLRRLGPRLYTPDLTTEPERLVQRNAIAVASARFPGAVLSHRSALEMKPADGYLFLTGSREHTDRLPGLTIRLMKGAGPRPEDMELMGLWRASDARALLENLRRTRQTSHVSRIAPRANLERWLEKALRAKGEEGLNALREQARTIASDLGWEEAFETLDAMLGALLGTREARLESEVGRARSAGEPFDEDRIALFEALFEELTTNWASTSRPVAYPLRITRQNLAFIDAYFSNYIEGTTFELDEAIDIVFEGRVVATRAADSHDVKGVYELLVDPRQLQISAAAFDSLEDLENLLQQRHRTIMRARPETKPGHFKDTVNRAGNTVFVEPPLVRGTLARGVEIFRALATPFQRAAFMAFMVTEIHPFNDGNGRLARAMMTAELAAGDETRIIIVTAYRDDYMNGLRILSRRGQPNDYVRMLDRAQEFCSRLDFDDLEALRKVLADCNAFDDTGLRPFKMPPAT